MSNRPINARPEELEKFDRSASRWWDPDGEFQPLHRMNPLRLDWIEAGLGGFGGQRVLDVGCGGGLLSEGMAARGGSVTGIDLASASLEVARLHALESGLTVDYRCQAVEDLAADQPATFDAIACLELLEHVPDPASVVTACARAVRPGGHVFFSTLNRTARAWALAIVGAEYVLRLLPRGTHDARYFIRPSELDRWGRGCGLGIADLTGVRYNPLTRTFELTRDVSVNYMAHYRPGAA